MDQRARHRHCVLACKRDVLRVPGAVITVRVSAVRVLCEIDARVCIPCSGHSSCVTATHSRVRYPPTPPSPSCPPPALVLSTLYFLVSYSVAWKRRRKGAAGQRAHLPRALQRGEGWMSYECVCVCECSVRVYNACCVSPCIHVCLRVRACVLEPTSCLRDGTIAHPR